MATNRIRNNKITITKFLESSLSLKDYRQKRNFKASPEPVGNDEKVNEKKRIFVIQKHAARRLHYDLRLEMDGVLKSWAVPKEPPKEAGVKRLAVQVEDHPLEYANFEGTIPEGHYGAGKVEIWDKGSYVLRERTENKIVFDLEGEKLRGTYVLLRFRGDENWLFFKKKEK